MPLTMCLLKKCFSPNKPLILEPYLRGYPLIQARYMRGYPPHISPLSEDLREIVQKLGKRAPPSVIKQVIKQLSSSRPFKPNEIALLLQRNQRYMRDHYLTPMVESGELELGFPDNPAHFQQSYQTKIAQIPP
jgi:hypothetical protein